MKKLSFKHLKSLVNTCFDKPRYIGGVAVPLEDVPKTFALVVEATSDREEGLFNIYRQRVTSGSALIEFKNGSLIHVIPGVQASRGFAFHELLVHKDIDEEVVRNVLIPTEKVRYKHTFSLPE